jgi:hypothetical protein
MNTRLQLGLIPTRAGGAAYQGRHQSRAARARTRAARAVLLLGLALGILGAVAPGTLGHGIPARTHPGARQPAVSSHSRGPAPALATTIQRPWMY